MKDKFSFYKEYPKTCHEDDFWGQVKRTVNGRAVSEEQISMIVSTCTNALCLNQKDKLLDLCCGNGALTDLFFNYCAGGLGVDFSEYLVDIANKNFNRLPDRQYLLQDAVSFCQTPYQAEIYTKAICYGSFSYLEKTSAELLLFHLFHNFPYLSHVFIGNCPDKDMAKTFYSERSVINPELDNPNSAIGIWRTKDEFRTIAEKYGWQVAISNMSVNFYAANYRYDVVLTREL